jgi:hypothetical protein
MEKAWLAIPRLPFNSDPNGGYGGISANSERFVATRADETLTVRARSERANHRVRLQFPGLAIQRTCMQFRLLAIQRTLFQFSCAQFNEKSFRIMIGLGIIFEYRARIRGHPLHDFRVEIRDGHIVLREYEFRRIRLDFPRQNTHRTTLEM